MSSPVSGLAEKSKAGMRSALSSRQEPCRRLFHMAIPHDARSRDQFLDGARPFLSAAFDDSKSESQAHNGSMLLRLRSRRAAVVAVTT